MEITDNLEQRFQELLFLENNPTDPKLQLILLAHAMNLTNGLVCNGLLEDDPENQAILPANWKNDVEGVFSFRYIEPTTKETFFFKFVTEEDNVDVNAVSVKANDKLFSFELKAKDYPKLDSDTIKKIHQKYKTEFLDKFLPEKKEESYGGGGYPIYTKPDFTIPRGDPRTEPNPLGDYGRKDIDPFSAGPFGGNLVGPNSNIFQQGGIQQQPKIRFDPFGPGKVDPTDPDPDSGFFPFDPFNKKPGFGPKRDPFGGGGGFGGGGFGGGGFGGGGFGGGFV